MSILDTQNKEDTEILVRMLYYCSEPRLASQIKSYCEIDGIQFNKFTDHCITRGLLRKFFSQDGLFSYVVTDHGKETLATAQEVMKALEIKVAIPENAIQTIQMKP
ncbi:MAG: hypothetical protein PXY39_11715 [archaeon]|nr:hypothetical protein [archaeon]